MTDVYVWLPTFFSYFFSQLFVDSGAIPPFVRKTRGLNEDFSTMSVKIILSTLRNPFSAQHQTLQSLSCRVYISPTQSVIQIESLFLWLYTVLILLLFC